MQSRAHVLLRTRPASSVNPRCQFQPDTQVGGRASSRFACASAAAASIVTAAGANRRRRCCGCAARSMRARTTPHTLQRRPWPSPSPNLTRPLDQARSTRCAPEHARAHYAARLRTPHARHYGTARTWLLRTTQQRQHHGVRSSPCVPCTARMHTHVGTHAPARAHTQFKFDGVLHDATQEEVWEVGMAGACTWQHRWACALCAPLPLGPAAAAQRCW